MNILVTGANGQLGNEMRIVTKGSKDRYIFTDVCEDHPESVEMLHKSLRRSSIAGVTCSSDFQKLDKTKQRETISQLREIGASVRQLERLTGISRGIIQFAKL